MLKNRTFAFAGSDEFCSVIYPFIENEWHLKAVLPSNSSCKSLIQIGEHEDVPNMGWEITSTVADDLVKLGTEVLLISGYPKIIPHDIFSKFKTINIHPSYLPYGRGIWPQPSIIYGNFQAAGVTLHKMDKNFDTGNVILREKVGVEKCENLHTLMFKQAILAETMADNLATNFDILWQNSREQEKLGTEEAPTVPKSINWSMNVTEIDKIIRSIGQSGVSANIKNSNLLIFNDSIWKQEHRRKIGTLIFDWGCGPVVAASDGYVHISDFESK